MKAYLEMWKRTFDFKGSVKRNEYWSAIFLNIIIGFVILITVPNVYVFIGYVAISVIPMLSITVRRLHDINKTILSLFLLFIPVFGWAILLFALASLSREDKDKEFDRYHW